MSTKTRDQQLYDIGQSVGVTYDMNAWKNFAVKPEQVEKLWLALKASGILNPVAPPPAPPVDLFSAALGPRFEDLNTLPQVDNRPTLFTAPDKPGIVPGNRCDPYQIAAATGPRPDGDYWASSGQVAYIPDNPADPGVARVQGLAYTNHCFAIKPRPDGGKTLYTEPHLAKYTIKPGKLVAAVRNAAMLSNDALAVFDNGVIGGMGTITDGVATPIKVAQLPANKKPTAIALTTSNEFALVALTDTNTGKGQVAVIALEGKFLDWTGHTWPHLGLPNQGSWSDFAILGYIDLPFSAPDQIAAASNGFWSGPSSSNGSDLGQINITAPNIRSALREGEYGWQKIIATGGYVIVSSRSASQVMVIDLAPLFADWKRVWLSDDLQPITIAERKAGKLPSNLKDFSTLGLGGSVYIFKKPTALLAGQMIDRWSTDFHKAYVATENGMVSIFDTSSLMARWDFEQKHELKVVGTVQVGRNPTSLAFARFNPWRLVQLIPRNQQGVLVPDPLNNLFYACCRGDRRIDAVETFKEQGRVYVSLQDQRMNDPVAVAVCDRNNLVYVCDYSGKKICTFRMWDLEDRQDPWQNPQPPRILWPVGAASDGSKVAEYYELPVPGKPFHFQTSNVN